VEGDPTLAAVMPRETPRETATPDDRELVRVLAQWSMRCREIFGMSQERVARRAGKSQGAISRLESGRCVATPLITYRAVERVYRKLALEAGVTFPEPGVVRYMTEEEPALQRDPARVAWVAGWNAATPRQRVLLEAVVKSLLEGLGVKVPGQLSGGEARPEVGGNEEEPCDD
jgi:transcriptional regulator with XRE-family HTH domain